MAIRTRRQRVTLMVMHDVNVVGAIVLPRGRYPGILQQSTMDLLDRVDQKNPRYYVELTAAQINSMGGKTRVSEEYDVTKHVTSGAIQVQLSVY